MLTGIAVVGVSFVAARMALAVAVGGALTSAIVAPIAGGRGSGPSTSGLPAALVLVALSAMPPI